MPRAERVGDRIVLAAEYRERERIKQLPGARWSTEEQRWWMPLSWAACQQLRGVFGSDLVVGAGLGAWARAELETRIRPCLELREAADCEILASVFTKLLPFQRAGTRFLATAEQALLADEMGLGKTVQCIAALELLGNDAYPVLVVCPNSMKLTWEQEIKRWAPGRQPIVISGSAEARRKAIAQLRDGAADVGILHYEVLRQHTRLESYGGRVTLSDEEKREKELNTIAWGTVVADEAHRAKDPRAKQTRALWWVGKSARYRFALTGTPVANSPDDAWTLMRFVAPAEFPAKQKFVDRYGVQSFNIAGFPSTVGIKSETRDELFRVLDPRLIRRTKEAVLPQLPPKTYAVRYCEMAPKQRRAYDEMRRHQITALDSGMLVATNALATTTRLLQFASAHGQLVDGTLRLAEPSCKADALVEIVAELGEQQAVVFAESRQLIELCVARLSKEGYKIGQVTGVVSPIERTENVRMFQEGRLKILLLTLGAGGEGLTLTSAGTAIFLQRSWSRVKNVQAEDRIHRIGQTENVQIIDVITQDSIESKVHAAGAYKRDMSEEIVRDEDTLRRWLCK